MREMSTAGLGIGDAFSSWSTKSAYRLLPVAAIVEASFEQVEIE
jgi:hypothetical protein